MNIRYFILPLVLFLSPVIAAGQEKISAEDAVGIALKNNYDILVARNSSDISRINNTAGNAGMLPTVAVTTTDNYSYSNVDQKYSTGTTIQSPDAHANSLNSNLALNWTLFDGGKMFVTKNKLNEIQSLGDIQFRDQVQQTVYNVIVAYYDVVREKQQLASIEEVIKANQTMVNILQTSFGAGLSAKTNLLQSQIDLNVYRENAINQKAVIIASKRLLNQLLSRDPDTPVEVADSITLNYVPDREEFKRRLLTTNTSILMLQKEVDIAQLSIQELRAMLLPRLSMNAAFNYLYSNNSANNLTRNQTYGPQVGGTLTIPIFQAGNAVRQIKVSRVQLQTTQYDLESVKLQVTNSLQNSLTAFDYQLQLLEIEKSNSELAKENLSITMERLRLGQTTSLELHQAQESYVNSLTRLTNFKYFLKVAETKLKQIMSEL
ncbi:MAG TPA: TolC family protein [Bacteroidales bacterium]|nr:TolC family protein [Bacteroidales bacterium]